MKNDEKLRCEIAVQDGAFTIARSPVSVLHWAIIRPRWHQPRSPGQASPGPNAALQSLASCTQVHLSA
jgi:hypothetical protein